MNLVIIAQQYIEFFTITLWSQSGRYTGGSTVLGIAKSETIDRRRMSWIFFNELLLSDGQVPKLEANNCSVQGLNSSLVIHFICL